ncbi:ADP-ribosylglycohydrolase family protein [Streptomyces halobius]|uniref:ADP-ribosylglycohydrolase family protein n=1 Tax=Streptomyces halobius TaxID=2879846 RepID=A0ABY4MED2_9ACTN|nr:ADP-ribosylglycohydrolase family protein [Streptomyces halobius]UQA96045.1 ADP-ribosylglycohydrolase family protein [Streptomyces halobius]
MTATAVHAAASARPRPLRLTWVQPEDLIGHELRQAAEDGRDAAGIAHRWRAAGGAPAPGRAGASPAPADPSLRALAGQLLDELALLPCPLEADEPTDLAAIEAAREDAASPALRSTPCPGAAALTARLEAGWVGRAAGCLLGKPVEKLPLSGIRALARSTGNWPLISWFTELGLDRAVAARHPWNRRSRATSLAENIDGMPEDDDLNYPLLGLLLLERHGHDFRTADVARLWLDELPAGRTFTAERLAYRNLLDGIEPPHTARHRNPFREWIGAQIRADIFGWTHPGDPVAAAAAAWRDATLSHTANGVYGAMFAAAAVATAAGGTAAGGTAAGGRAAARSAGVRSALRAGLAVIPGRSRLARAVRFGIRAARDEPTGTAAGFAAVVDRLHTAYGHHHWVHAVPNAALVAAALTHADGDFSGSICRAVSGGWDTDSNGATAGSIAGLLAGTPAALPARWTEPLRNRLATTVGGLDGIGFDTLAARTAALVPADRRPDPLEASAP